MVELVELVEDAVDVVTAGRGVDVVVVSVSMLDISAALRFFSLASYALCADNSVRKNAMEPMHRSMPNRKPETHGTSKAEIQAMTIPKPAEIMPLMNMNEYEKVE